MSIGLTSWEVNRYFHYTKIKIDTNMNKIAKATNLEIILIIIFLKIQKYVFINLNLFWKKYPST